MKKLIQLAILLFSLNCYSQNSIDSYPCIDMSNVNKPKTTIYLYGKKYNQEKESILFVDSVYLSSPKISFQDLFDYQKECYNDSTIMFEWSCWEGIGFLYNWWFENQQPFNCECDKTGAIKFIHKQPTFEEFIEWIKINKFKEGLNEIKH